jgi:putative flippase GtrA
MTEGVVLRQLLRFGMVGVAGFLIDVAVLYMALALLGTGPYTGRALSYLVAASSTWYLNRRVTFADSRSTAPGPEWLKFVFFNVGGGSLNYATYAAWLHYAGSSSLAPAWGVALGSLAGLCLNFTLSRQLVFRRPGRTVNDSR